MLHKTIRTSRWTLTIILSLLFVISAVMKITSSEAALEQAASIGMDAETYRLIGLIELISLILFLIPRTGVVGSLLLIAYMGGAIATHIQHQQPVMTALVVQVLVWLTVALRFPELTGRLFPFAQKILFKD